MWFNDGIDLKSGTITSPASAELNEWWQEGSVIAARTDQSRVAVGGLHQNTSWDAQPVGILQSVLVRYFFEHDDVPLLQTERKASGEANNPTGHAGDAPRRP